MTPEQQQLSLFPTMTETKAPKSKKEKAGVSREAPAFVILPHPQVRLEVYVHREAVDQWIRWFPNRPPTSVGSNRTHLEIAQAMTRFNRWVRSLERQSPRCRKLNCQGVRLWINGAVVAAFCVDEAIAFLPGVGGTPRRPKKKTRKKGK